MSDSSEDDFMSDKYLIAAEATSKPSTQSYAQRRQLAAKRHLEAQVKPRAVREEEARRRALETSLFERTEEQSVGAGKAMGMMMKMGWEVGEGLGKRDHGASSPTPETRDPGSDDDAPAPLGIGASKRRKLSPTAGPARTEPIRLSLWAGKSGLGAHQRSPSPENMSFLLRQTTAQPSKGPGKELDLSADEFRRRRAQVADLKRDEAREWAARNLLMEFDQAKGIPFHPLWIIPTAALQTIPRPLLVLIDPTAAADLPETDTDTDTDRIRGRSPEGNTSAADEMRAAMRRDALVDLSEDPTPPKPRREASPPDMTDWKSYIPGVQRVLHMSPATHLSYLIDSLRVDHLYCFWCAARYGSIEEMEGPGGCPGPEEDDH